MRILTYGLSTDKLAGIDTFLLNMNKFMSDEVVFDYVIEGDYTIHQQQIENKGGNMHFIAPKRNMLQNTLDWNRLLRREKKNADVARAVYFNLYSLAWMIPMFLCKLHGYKVIIHAHNNMLHNCGMVQKMLHSFSRWLFQYFKIVRFTNSELSTKFFFGKRPAEMIYNAIDTSRFAFNADVREKIRCDLGFQGKNVYGFAGRLAYQKNPLFLMDVFEEISKLDSNAAFLVCGDGDLEQETKASAAAKELNVSFVGAKPNIQDYYQAMDVFVFPSRFEGLGLVLIEAQTAGLGCVTSADVVPLDAKVTDLLEYISLNCPAQEWAAACVNKNAALKSASREAYFAAVSETDFEIRKEAPRLESLLLHSAQ